MQSVPSLHLELIVIDQTFKPNLVGVNEQQQVSK